MGGYQKSMLEIDLRRGLIGSTSLGEDLLRSFLGGSGLAARLFLNRFSPRMDPLSAENSLFVFAGPLTGTHLPGTGRLAVAAKSPITNIWGESNCGGHFGAELKFAGYEGITIKGASEKPVYLLIEDDKVEIKDASSIWGKDVYQVIDVLTEEFKGKRKVKVLTIGPAGENLVKFAAIAGDKGDFAGRCGLGAVMGSKRLKAVVVRGSNAVPPAFPDDYEELLKRTRAKVGESPLAHVWHEHGTDIGMVAGTKTGGVSGRNWTTAELYDFAKPLRGFSITSNYLVGRKACHACPIGCKREVKINAGPYQMEEGPGPEFQTCCNFGLMLMNNNLEGVMKANELCNRYGLDTISCGATIAFATECFENGVIGKQDTGGIELRWGNIDGALEMIHRIARREGFGDVLAEGSKTAARKIGGKAAEYVVEVKGIEMSMHDPRGYHGQGLGHAVANRGGTHLDHLNWLIEENFSHYPDLGLAGDYAGKTSTGKAALTCMSENIVTLCNGGVMCLYVMGCLSFDDLVEMFRVTTGFDYDREEILRCSERIWLLKRGLNNLMGITALDDRLPKRVLTPLESGPTAGSVPDMDLMLKEYYELRGLDSAGRPRKERLAELNLNDLVDRLFIPSRAL